ncbi:CapA family protein [Anaerocolumna aminovalerica]|uniref:CapA family protein n=1 Tax=Anaerocolumna aminovalerica TaxID=1527 RepID=UPI000BE33F14|nr:CapA family protein [Anaerocolumna aminovalerica]
MSKKKFHARLRTIVIIICILTVGIIGELIAYSYVKISDKAREDSYVEKDLNNSDNKETAIKDPDKDTNTAPEENNSDETKEEGRDSVKENPYEDDNNSGDKNTDEIVMLFTGDIYFSDFILNQYNKKGLDGILSENIQEEFHNAHIVMANEEFPFSKRGSKAKDKQFTFRIDPQYVQIFSDMMINVVTLGNNHVLDYGTEALLDTFSTLQDAKIPYVGAGNNLKEARETKYFDVGEKTVAILGASRVIPVTEWNAGENKPGLFTTYDPTALIAEIETAKLQSDYVIVYVHWGIEKKNHPEEYQRKMAKQYIDAGADLVVGSHPHVLQGMEYYKGKPIIYSLGNFMFYSNIPQTALLKVTLQKGDSVKTELLPAKAENGTTFIIEDTKEIQQFYKYMTDISYGVTFDKSGAISY